MTEASGMTETSEPTVLNGGDGSAGPQRIPVNVYETTEAVVVVAPMPGVMPDDVEVVASGHELRLRARLRTAAPKDYRIHDWDYGGYDRTIDLPPEFPGDVTASLGNGQLAVRVAREGTRSGAPIIVQPESPLED